MTAHNRHPDSAGVMQAEPPANAEQDDGDGYDEEEDFEEPVDITGYVRKIGFALMMLALVQLGTSSAMLYLADVYRNDNDRFNVRDVFSGCVGVFTGLVGLIAGALKAELMTRLYFVLQLWLLSTSTGYLYFTNKQDTAMQQLCSPNISYSSGESSYECRSVMAANQAKLALAICGLLLSLAACLLTFEFEDALDDWSDQKKAERLVEEMDQAGDDEQDLGGFVMDDSMFPSNKEEMIGSDVFGGDNDTHEAEGKPSQPDSKME